MTINALCTANALTAKKYCDKVFTTEVINKDGFVVLNQDFATDSIIGDIYLNDMLDEELFVLACDRIMTANCKAVVRASFDLDEAGKIEAKYKLSPIMLLHKMGVLGNCTIVGGVCLDNDDLDLMAQESVPLILLPTTDAGYGHGFAPVTAAVRRGIRVGVGTFDGKYNKAHSIDYELEFLRLTANAEMSWENVLSDETLKRIAAFE
ncbi:MAG: hypothetical protein HDT28_03245 [Clostridiales bacterium]|nr:hypothetical protein [Clostridiales bacterium]